MAKRPERISFVFMEQSLQGQGKIISITKVMYEFGNQSTVRKNLGIWIGENESSKFWLNG